MTNAACSGPCRAGKYGSTYGATNDSCNGPCSPGYACPAGSNSSAAVLCLAGTYGPGGAGTCSPCPEGRYGANSGLTSSMCSGGTGDIGVRLHGVSSCVSSGVSGYF
jgi:hypothetical protein